MPPSTGDKILGVLELFAEDGKPAWTAEEIAEVLEISNSTAYRYLKSLVGAQLIDQRGGEYLLGPGVFALYRQLQLHDPMLQAARPVMNELIGMAGERSTVILCRLFRNSVMCVHQELHYGPQQPVGYEVGKPRPMFHGSASKVILANLPTRRLRQIYAENLAELTAAGLGPTWKDFLRKLKAIRQTPALTTRGEVDMGRVGIASPIFEPGGAVIGCISVVLMEDAATPAMVDRVSVGLSAAAHMIGRSLADRGKAGPELAVGVEPAGRRRA